MLLPKAVTKVTSKPTTIRDASGQPIIIAKKDGKLYHAKLKEITSEANISKQVDVDELKL